MSKPERAVRAAAAAAALSFMAIALAGCPGEEVKGRSPADAQPASETSQMSPTAETEGICKGLDLAVTLDMRVCLDRRFKLADGKLNERYQELMASIGETRKAQLKREQIRWIREKEAKCPRAGTEFAGGTLEPVVIADCYVTMTEKRLQRLMQYQ
ncbi:lysozyme inhibitor LprI family protein [Paracidovorax citrulli]